MRSSSITALFLASCLVLTVSLPSSLVPVAFAGNNASPGKPSMLSSVELARLSGTAALSGTVAPERAGARVTLLYEGKEHAATTVGPGGKYEFTALRAGIYTLQAEAPGYAVDSVEVRIPENQKAAQNIRLLFVSSIDGVDWGRGTIRAKGRGLFPTDATNRTVRYELAKRAALSEAERNLLKIIEQLKVGPNQDLRTTAASFTVRLQGFIHGHKIVGERELDSGVEVELELPLTGTAGLTRLLAD